MSRYKQSSCRTTAIQKGSNKSSRSETFITSFSCQKNQSERLFLVFQSFCRFAYVHSIKKQAPKSGLANFVVILEKPAIVRTDSTAAYTPFSCGCHCAEISPQKNASLMFFTQPLATKKPEHGFKLTAKPATHLLSDHGQCLLLFTLFFVFIRKDCHGITHKFR